MPPSELPERERRDSASAPGEVRHRVPGVLRHRVFCSVWALGVAAHLSLPDAMQWEWLVPDLLLGAGALLLVLKPDFGTVRSLVAWALMAVGLTWPLLALGDQLSQSGFMALVCLSALMLRRDEAGFNRAVRLLTLGVYAIAVFHKLNVDFFDPQVSCASGGMKLLAANWSVPLAPEALAPVWPYVFIATESSLVFLLIVRPRLGLLLAAFMHIPLTVVFAPSFAWVMAPGWVAFLTEREIELMVAFVRVRWKRIVLAGLSFAILSAAFYFRDHWIAYPSWQLKEAALWIVAMGLLAFEWKGPSRDRAVWREGRNLLPWIPLALFACNAMTPYVGLQFHHAGAMLSNLRVDEGCWNHLIVPEGVRGPDPYVRIESVRVSPSARGASELERLLQERLWHPAELRADMPRYCDQGAGPVRLSLTYLGVRHEVDDACAGLPLPEQPVGLFQTNLARDCPQNCVH